MAQKVLPENVLSVQKGTLQIRRLPYFALAKFGFVLGGLGCLVPALLLSIAGFAIVHALRTWLEGMQKINIQLLGRDITTIDLIAALRVQGARTARPFSGPGLRPARRLTKRESGLRATALLRRSDSSCPATHAHSEMPSAAPTARASAMTPPRARPETLARRTVGPRTPPRRGTVTSWAAARARDPSTSASRPSSSPT